MNVGTHPNFSASSSLIRQALPGYTRLTTTPTQFFRSLRSVQPLHKQQTKNSTSLNFSNHDRRQHTSSSIAASTTKQYAPLSHPRLNPLTNPPSPRKSTATPPTKPNNVRPTRPPRNHLPPHHHHETHPHPRPTRPHSPAANPGTHALRPRCADIPLPNRPKPLPTRIQDPDMGIALPPHLAAAT